MQGARTRLIGGRTTPVDPCAGCSPVARSRCGSKWRLSCGNWVMIYAAWPPQDRYGLWQGNDDAGRQRQLKDMLLCELNDIATGAAAGTAATLALVAAIPNSSGVVSPMVKAIFWARVRAICMATPYTAIGTGDPVVTE